MSLLLFHNCIFVTAMNHNVTTSTYRRSDMGPRDRGRDPHVENHCSRHFLKTGSESRAARKGNAGSSCAAITQHRTMPGSGKGRVNANVSLGSPCTQIFWVTLNSWATGTSHSYTGFTGCCGGPTDTTCEQLCPRSQETMSHI